MTVKVLLALRVLHLNFVLIKNRLQVQNPPQSFEIPGCWLFYDGLCDKELPVLVSGSREVVWVNLQHRKTYLFGVRNFLVDNVSVHYLYILF